MLFETINQILSGFHLIMGYFVSGTAPLFYMHIMKLNKSTDNQQYTAELMKKQHFRTRMLNTVQ